MDYYRRFVTEFVPNALRKVPVPDSLSGIFSLSASELATLAVFSSVSGFLAYSVYTTCRHHLSSGGNTGKGVGNKDQVVNWSIQKDKDKVVNTIDIEEIGEKASLCRCWRSKKFPYCDGSHNQHNKDTGDNVGPVLIKKSN